MATRERFRRKRPNHERSWKRRANQRLKLVSVELERVQTFLSLELSQVLAIELKLGSVS